MSRQAENVWKTIVVEFFLVKRFWFNVRCNVFWLETFCGKFGRKWHIWYPWTPCLSLGLGSTLYLSVYVSVWLCHCLFVSLLWSMKCLLFIICVLLVDHAACSLLLCVWSPPITELMLARCFYDRGGRGKCSTFYRRHNPTKFPQSTIQHSRWIAKKSIGELFYLSSKASSGKRVPHPFIALMPPTYMI